MDPRQIGNDALGNSVPPEMALLKNLIAALSGATLPSAVSSALGSFRGAPQAVSSLTPNTQGFSQADMLAARILAGAKQQAPIMKSEQLAQPLMGTPGARPMLGGRGVDLADNGFSVPSEAMNGGGSVSWGWPPIKKMLESFRN